MRGTLPRHDTRSFRDANWHALLGACRVGDPLRFAPLTATLFERLFAQGFWRIARDTWQKSIELHVPEQVVACDVPSLPNLGCIVVPSVLRAMPAGQEHYLFATLRSLFASMPSGIAVNVMLGNSDAHFLRAEALEQALGADAQHVHVFAAPTATEAHLLRHATLRQRTTWNHARALCSYQGDGKVLFVEDDVQWSRAASHFVGGASWLREPSITSLYHAPGYNSFCDEKEPCAQQSLLRIRADRYGGLFSCCQSLLYEARFAREVAAMLSLRLNAQPTDLNMADYFARERTWLGFSTPSLVQHMGNQSSGLSRFHQAICFAADPP